jgi:C1A family cysteine protease
MKLAIVLLAVVGVTMACDSKKDRDEFESFRRQYRKYYQNQAEEDYRCTVFAENYLQIEQHNLRHARGLETYTLGINKYSDLTNEEFMEKYTGLKPELEQKSRIDMTHRQVRKYNPTTKAPASIDWVEKGFVTPIKSQGACGSCYSFATTAVAESRYLIQKNTPYDWKDLSEQQLVECSGGYGNQKCQGGLMTNSYRYYITENHGCNTEENYPYVSTQGSNGTECKYDKNNYPLRVTGFVELDKDDSALEQAVADGPVAVGVNAETWKNYEDGVFCPKGGLIFAGCSGLLLNHAVVVVGYTQDYWIIKNSWGTTWGEGGYMRLCRKYTNNCGINKLCSYPLVA